MTRCVGWSSAFDACGGVSANLSPIIAVGDPAQKVMFVTFKIKFLQVEPP